MSRGSENRGASYRVQRVEREIREAIGSYLLGGFRGELHGMVSVSRVIASKDLRTAKVFVTVMGSEEDRKASVAELQAHSHEVQHEVNRRLQMKFCPKLTFLYDEGFDNVLRVEQILRDLGEQRAKNEAGDRPASEGAEEDGDSED